MFCSACVTDQPRSQFGPSADQWPDRRECKRCARRRSSIRKHGVDADDKARIAEAQGGCRICGHTEPSSRGWVVDHDRACCPGDKSCPKCRRGVICQWCNTVLASAFDRPAILLAAVEYLNRAPGMCSWHKPLACAPSICNGHLLRGDVGHLLRSNATYERDVLTNEDGAGTSGSLK